MQKLEHEQYRRQFPRRAFKGLVGLLLGGDYSIFKAGEIGEGGMSILATMQLPVGRNIVLNFQIPGGPFVSVRAVVRSERLEGDVYNHGVAFENMPFDAKRKIRTFVSARTENE